MEVEMIAMQEIFQFERTGVDPAGKVMGHFRSCGIRPRFAERLKQYGMELPAFF
jgi:pilus assembly protein CpaF